VGLQGANTQQAAAGLAVSHQNAVNANVPVNIAGGNVSSGPSSANQTATSTATTDVSNRAKTDQDQSLRQNVGGSGCYAGCGGAGGFQLGVQGANTSQVALGAAKSDQNAVNANVPVNIAGGNVSAGPSDATQTATSTADTDVSNKAKTDQDQKLKQDVGGSDSCKAGCGGAGGFQAGVQLANTDQKAIGIAKSDQNAVNANVPVNIAGGDIKSGPSSATQTATSTATTDVSNKAKTDQDQHLSQDIGGGSCYAGCGGAGGFQAGVQLANTEQGAIGISKSDQNAVNANVPVNIAGGNVYSGPSNATQTATSTAETDVSNKAKTDQDQKLKQDIGGSDSKSHGDYGDMDAKSRDDHGSDGCYAGCGGAGGFQLGVQKANTEQWALGVSKSDQNAVNANTPVSVAGGDISSGPSSATQTATSTADTDVSNKAKTDQDQKLKQDIGDSGSCKAGCGGAGGFQAGIQLANTEQWAAGYSESDQNAVNANAPSSTAGGNIYSGPSDATQTATSTADTDVSNRAKTDQDQKLKQDIGGSDSCKAGCGGPGGFQAGVQLANTEQWAAGASLSNQNAVNSNAPASVAGYDINSGPSSANQTATSTATTDVSNKAKTDQDQKLKQAIGSDSKSRKDYGDKGDSKSHGDYGDKGDSKSGKDYGDKSRKDHGDGCSAGCGGAGGFQLGIQLANTEQWAAGLSFSDQNAVNGNSPSSTAGGNIADGPSSANQTASSTGETDVANRAKTDQNQHERQFLGALQH